MLDLEKRLDFSGWGDASSTSIENINISILYFLKVTLY